MSTGKQVLRNASRLSTIGSAGSTPPFDVPPGHVGPFVVPGSGRLVWWTGRVAIGLRHEAERRGEALSRSAEWLQGLLIDKRVRRLRSA